MNKQNTLVQGNNRKVQISQTKLEKYNHNRTRTKHPFQRFTGGRGRGHGRGGLRSRPYNPYAMVRNSRNNSKPEVRIYSREEYSNLTPTQKSQEQELKSKNGWLNGLTPSPGFQINKGTGEVELTSQLISTIRAATTNTSHYGQSYEQESIDLPPSPHFVRDSINTAGEGANSIHVGSFF